MPDIKILASDLGFPEGPVWMADGSVILGEISGRKVTRIAPDGSKTEIGKAGGGPNGVATGPDGALYVCNNGGAVYQTTPSFLSTGPAPDYKSGSIQVVVMIEFYFFRSASGSRSVFRRDCAALPRAFLFLKEPA